MNVGKTLGYVLLSCVDALLPPIFIVGLVWGVLPYPFHGVVLTYLLVLAGVSFLLALVAGFVLVRRGGKPFPVTRSIWRFTKKVPLWLWH
jgi:hypothetical protein